MVQAKGCSNFPVEQIVSSWMQVRTASLSAESCILARAARRRKGTTVSHVCFFHMVGLSVYSLKEVCPKDSEGDKPLNCIST